MNEEEAKDLVKNVLVEDRIIFETHTQISRPCSGLEYQNQISHLSSPGVHTAY